MPPVTRWRPLKRLNDVRLRALGLKGPGPFWLGWNEVSAVSFMYARGSDWLQESKWGFSHRVLDRHPCISIRLHGYTFFREIPV